MTEARKPPPSTPSNGRSSTKVSVMIEEIQRRIDTAERNLSDLARSLTALTDELGKSKNRILELEQAHHDRRVSDAALAATIEQIKADLGAIKSMAARAMWTFVGAFILAFAAFVLRGGLGPV